MKTKMDTSIRIKNATRLRLKKAIVNAEMQTYDEWINKKLDEEKPSKNPNQ